MAQILIKGSWATVELTFDPEEDHVIATCVEHSEFDGRLAPPGDCAWSTVYDDLNDAAEYAADHADTGKP